MRVPGGGPCQNSVPAAAFSQAPAPRAQGHWLREPGHRRSQVILFTAMATQSQVRGDSRTHTQPARVPGSRAVAMHVTPRLLCGLVWLVPVNRDPRRAGGHLRADSAPRGRARARLEVPRGDLPSSVGRSRGGDGEPGGRGLRDREDKTVLYPANVQNSCQARDLFIPATPPRQVAPAPAAQLLLSYLEDEDTHMRDRQADPGALPVRGRVKSEAVHFQLPGDFKHLEIRLGRRLAPGTDESVTTAPETPQHRKRTETPKEAVPRGRRHGACLAGTHKTHPTLERASSYPVTHPEGPALDAPTVNVTLPLTRDVQT